MEKLIEYGIPIYPMLVGGGIVWVITQICKKAMREKKLKYLLLSAAGSLVVAILLTKTGGTWDWLSYTWISLGIWIFANIGHKLYAKYLKKSIEKLVG